MYKRGQGTLVRAGMLAVLFCFAFYTAYTWYTWYLMSFDPDSAATFYVALAGAVILGGGLGAISIWSAIINPRCCEFMINADAELRKVIWPAVQPLFDKKAEAWGATYVVIMMMVIMTVFLYVVDIVLERVLQNGILLWLYT